MVASVVHIPGDDVLVIAYREWPDRLVDVGKIGGRLYPTGDLKIKNAYSDLTN